MKIQYFSAAMAALFLVGCSTSNTIYQWNSFEDQIYSLYSDPGKVPFEKQISALEEDYQKARSENKPVPPGFHAHLGYLYFQAGKSDQAIQSFQTEKSQFPESAVFMDRIVKKFKQ